MRPYLGTTSQRTRGTLLGRLMSGARMSGAEWRAVLLRDPCVFCGKSPRALDHIRPKDDGGPDGWENRAPVCHACNLMKSNVALLMVLWRMNERRNGRTRQRVIARRNGQPVAWITEYGDRQREAEHGQ